MLAHHVHISTTRGNSVYLSAICDTNTHFLEYFVTQLLIPEWSVSMIRPNNNQNRPISWLLSYTAKARIRRENERLASI